MWGFFFIYLFSWIFYGNDRKLLLKFSNQKSLYRHNICRRMNAFSIKIRSIAIRRKYCLHVQRLHLNITNLWDVGTVRKLNLFINHVYLNLAPPLTYNMADAPPNWAMLKPICSSYSQRRFSSLNQTQTMFRQKKKKQAYNFNLNFNEFFSSSSKKAATSWLLLNTRYSWLLAAKFVAKPVSVSGQRMAAALFGRGSLLSKIKPQLADWRNGWLPAARHRRSLHPFLVSWRLTWFLAPSPSELKETFVIKATK